MTTNSKLATGMLVAALGAGTGYVLVTPKAASDLPPLPAGMKAEAVTVPPAPQADPVVFTNAVPLAWNIENNFEKHAHERWPMRTGIVGMWTLGGPREKLYECSTFDENGNYLTGFTATVVTTNRFFDSFTK